MKLRLTTACFVVAAAMLPLAGYAAENSTDTDRAHPKAFVKDSVITTKIKAKLAEEKPGSLAHIGVDTHDKGAVLLTGTAKTQEDADRAASIARDTEGVTSVKSKIRIKKDA